MTVILAFSSTRYSPRQIDYALEVASGKGWRLTACLVVDTRLTEAISEEVSDMGFLGERVSDEFREAVLEEYERQGARQLERMGERARERGVSFSSRVEVGSFVDVCLSVATEEKAQEIVVTRADRTKVGRFVFGSPVNDLARRAPCRVTVVGREPSGVASESSPG